MQYSFSLLLGGDTACEEAIFLTKFASKVTIIHRRDEFRASKIMADRVFENEKIDVQWNCVVDEVLDDEMGVIGVKIKNTLTNKISEIECKGYFSAFGHKPNTDIFRGSLDMDDTGDLNIKGGSSGNATQCSIEGGFAAGDVSDSIYRQAITSAGAGCMAALDAEKYLDK